MLAGRISCSPADLLILLLLLGCSDSSRSASSAAEGSKRGSLCRPAMVGRKNGAFAGFLGGCTGLLRACTSNVTNLSIELSQVERLHQKEGKPPLDMLMSEARKTRHKQVDCNKPCL